MSSTRFTLTDFSVLHIRLFLLVIWFGIFVSQSQPLALFQDYAGFTLLGIIGAVFANASGAGGGVVFVPFFNQLEFSVATSVATSFAIQCCGMTAGALTWYAHYRRSKSSHLGEPAKWQALPKVLLLTIPASVIGLWAVQISPQVFAHFSDPHNLHTGFGIFSMGLSLAIFLTVFWLGNQTVNQELTTLDALVLVLVALVGGGITAWLSVGVGELVAVYLIMRRFDVTFAIATAVIISAFTVWAGIIFHLLVTQAVYWPVVFFAGAGAIIGGVLAKQLVLYFSVRSIKLFFAGWIFILGLVSLPF